MSRVIAPFAQFFNGEGDPLSDGWLSFLYTGTTSTLKITYSDVNETIPNENPLQLDAEGRCPNVFGQGIYRVVLYADNPVTHLPGEIIQVFDPVQAETVPAGAGGNFAEWDADITYQVGEIVIFNGRYYRSIIANSINNQPDTSPVYWEEIDFLRYWNTNVTYLIDNIVIYSSQIYFSLADANQGNQPDTSPTWWKPVGSGTVLTDWEESGTIFQPVIAGYDFGSSGNYIGTAYISAFGTFPLTPSSDPTNDYDVANKLYVDTLAADRMRWLGDWTPGTYEEFDVVRDDNWTMIANTQTEERPAPQPAGDSEWVRDLFSPPAFSETSSTESVLYIGQRYIFTSAFIANSLRVWIPASAVGSSIKVWAVYNPTGAYRIINLFPGSTVDSSQVDKWMELPFGQIYVGNGAIIDVILVMRSPTQENNFSYTWAYSKSNGDPGPGQIYHQGGSAVDEIRVHEQDNGLVDRTLDLDNLGPGSKMRLDSADFTWEILDVTKTGDVYTLIVDPGARSGNATSSVTFYYYGTSALYYTYNTNLFVSDARIRGYFGNTYDGSDAGYLNDNGYGIDLQLQNAIVSDDWDVVSEPVFGSSIGGGGGSSFGYWEEVSEFWRPITTNVGYLGDSTHLIQGIYLGDNDPVYFGDSQDASILFDGTDLALTSSGDVTCDKKVVVQQLEIGTNLQATTTDLKLSGNSNIATDSSMNFFIDSVDASTAHYFAWFNNAAFGVGNILMTLYETGTLAVSTGPITVAGNTVYHAGNDTNLAKLNGTQTFTGINTFSLNLDFLEDIVSSIITTGNTQVLDTTTTAIYLGNSVTQLILQGSGGSPIYYDGVNRTVYHSGLFDYTDYALDAGVVHLAGTETITGTKTFTVSPQLNNDIYLIGFDTSALARSLIGVTSSDVCQVGDGALPTEIISSGTVSVTQSNVVLENNRFLFGELTTTTIKSLIGITSSDVIQIGATSQQIDFLTNGTFRVYAGAFYDIYHSGIFDYTDYALDSSVVHLAGAETITGSKTFDADITLGSGVQLIFPSVTAGDCFYLSGNTFGMGISGGNNLNYWAPAQHEFRIGGTTATTGTSVFVITSSGNVYANGANLLIGANTSGDSLLQLYDLTNATYRSLFWDDSNSDWYIEDSTGTNRLLTHAGNLSTDDTLAGDSDTTAVSESAVKGYVDTAIVGVTSGVASFKNPVINGNFDFWQRGVNQASSTNNYGSDDRWRNGVVGATRTVGRVPFTQGQTTVPHSPSYYSRTGISVAGSATTDFVHKVHHIENVHTFSGQTVTLSFWAKATTSINMSSEFVQHPGTGGSPSSPVTAIGVTTHALTTSWQKFTVTTTLPNTTSSDITLGTNGDHTLRIFFWYDAGSSFNSRTNSLGHQTGTFDIAQVQLEKGTVATDFEVRPLEVEQGLCYRYFYQLTVGSSSVSDITSDAYYMVAVYGNLVGGLFHLPVSMRAAPTTAISGSNWYGRVSGSSTTYVITSINVQAARNGYKAVAILFNCSTTPSSAYKFTFVGNSIAGESIAFDAELY